MPHFQCLPSACSTGTMWEVALPCTMTSPTRWANWVTARTSPDTSITHIQENHCEIVTTWFMSASHLNRLKKGMTRCLNAFMVHLNQFRISIDISLRYYFLSLSMLSGEQWRGVTTFFCSSSSVKSAQLSWDIFSPTVRSVATQIATSRFCHNVSHCLTSKWARPNPLLSQVLLGSYSGQSWFRQFVFSNSICLDSSL